MRLASRFHNPVGIRSDKPLSDAQIMRYAPSIFAEAPHEGRSDRYTYIPTSTILRNLQKEGFQPFMAVQTRCRDASKKEHTKHMLRLRHVNQVEGQEANEIIMLNSHDGSSSYQMMSGVFRFVCTNGTVCGDVANEIRVPHKGNVVANVIEGAFRVLDDFDLVNQQKEGMKSISLSAGEQQAFAGAALALKYDPTVGAAPITADQLLTRRRMEDRPNDLWTTFNRVQENLIRGGLDGRTATGRNTTTRAVTGIDQDTKLNRALWILSESMRQIKA